jgi:hypothetical protein
VDNLGKVALRAGPAALPAASCNPEAVAVVSSVTPIVSRLLPGWFPTFSRSPALEKGWGIVGAKVGVDAALSMSAENLTFGETSFVDVLTGEGRSTEDNSVIEASAARLVPAPGGKDSSRRRSSDGFTLSISEEDSRRISRSSPTFSCSGPAIS